MPERIMMSIAKRNIVGLACVAAVILTSGSSCPRATGHKWVKCEYDPKGRKIAIIPFKDMAYDCFDSDEGRAIADSACWYLGTQNITPVRSERFFPMNVRAIYKKFADDPTMARRKMAEALGCDLLLTGQIESRISLRDPADVNVVKGRVVVSAQLYDMKDNGRAVWQMKRRQVVFPEGWEYDKVPTIDLPKWKLKNQLLQKAGEEIGKSFHDHLEPIGSRFGKPM